MLWPAGRVALNLVLIVAAAALVVFALVRLRLVVIPVLVALLISTLLVPVSDALERRRVPGPLAALLVLVGFLAFVLGAFALIAPLVAGEVDELTEAVRSGLDDLLGWLAQGPLGIDRDQVENAVDDGFQRLRDNAGPLARGVLGGALVVLEVVAGLLLALVVTFFFLFDGRRVWSWAVEQAPARHSELVDRTGRRIWEALSGYVRGVVVIALVDALLIGLALVIIGVPLVIPLMVLTFFGAFIPIVGAVAAGAAAALVALVTGGVVDAVLVVVAVTAIQQAESEVLYPLIVGKAISLHPLAILVILTGGGVLAGIVGALLAVPIGAAVWVAVKEVRGHSSREEAAPAVSSAT